MIKVCVSWLSLAVRCNKMTNASGILAQWRLWLTVSLGGFSSLPQVPKVLVAWPQVRDVWTGSPSFNSQARGMTAPPGRRKHTLPQRATPFLSLISCRPWDAIISKHAQSLDMFECSNGFDISSIMSRRIIFYTSKLVGGTVSGNHPPFPHRNLKVLSSAALSRKKVLEWTLTQRLS